MFNPKLEVPSLELCKKLKKLGYPQEGGGWYWIKTEDEEWNLFFIHQDYFSKEGRAEICNGDWVAVEYLEEDTTYYKVKEKIKAPTVRELGEQLPDGFHEFKLESEFYIKDKFDYTYVVSDKSEANARAKMLIWLVENGYINFKKEEVKK